MGGPSASVLLQAPLTTPQQHDLAQLLASLGVCGDDGIHLQIHTTHPIGGTYGSEQGRPFAVELVEPTIEALNPQLMVDTFGFYPLQAITLDAFANQSDDHRILGLLTLSLMERFSGIIDFGGALFPKLPSQLYDDGWFWQATWEDGAGYSRDLINSLPGVAIELTYMTGSDRTWVYHVADSTFLRAWLAHPDFHMIK
jgi:hypothetical protein